MTGPTRLLAQEVMGRCEVLARFSEEEGALTRTFLSPPMRDVHEQVGTWMREAGMSVRVDAVGNIIGRYGEGPTLLIGSHLDTVRNAGKYDGILGVLLGIAALKALENEKLPFAVEVIGFSEEEGVRFGVPFIGSKAVTGQLDAATLELRDSEGVNVLEAIKAFGLDPDAVPRATYRADDVLGFLEVHIEQGPQLADLDQPLGVVSAVAGSSRAQLTFTGKAGHAGTTPMNLRRDALAGAAAFTLEVESLARTLPALVATVGTMNVSPGAINVIPGRASLSLDVRHTDDDVRLSAVGNLKQAAETLASLRGLGLEWRDLMDQSAVPMDASLQSLLNRVAGTDTPTMPSGAGHDAMIMAPFTPTALLFMRSPNGVSHHPDETVDQEDVADALNTVTTFILSLTHHYGL